MIQYQTQVDWDVTLIDLEYTDIDNPLVKGLVARAVKITSGAPTATANRFMPGAIIANAVTGVLYSNTGTTASPVWSVIDVSSGGLPALANGNIWVGNASNVATAVTPSGDADISNTGVISINAVLNPLVATFIPSGSGPQALTGPGAVDIVSYQTQLTTTGTGDALTLVDGTKIGQLKKISYIAEGAGADTAILTPTNLAGFTTATFNDIGDYLVLMWDGTDWLAVDYVGVTLA